MKFEKCNLKVRVEVGNLSWKLERALKKSNHESLIMSHICCVSSSFLNLEMFNCSSTVGKIEFLKFLGIQPYLIGHNFNGNIILWRNSSLCLSTAYIRRTAKHEWNCILHIQLSPKAANVRRFVDEHCTLMKRPIWKVGIKTKAHHDRRSLKVRKLKNLKIRFEDASIHFSGDNGSNHFNSRFWGTSKIKAQQTIKCIEILQNSNECSFWTSVEVTILKDRTQHW